uniref:Thiol:disulfide interchange protein n=1 Tax=Thuretia quercifolia TaxID=189650 RepID=A0A1Z1MKL7_9FLOR|nr:thiol:disulfide interchange protein [Thuretia quercifolia]ARW66345.1 thiol:disulfide interchange protein [Thuretia quercifolia]
MINSLTFWSNYELILYNLQQKIILLLYLRINSITPDIIFLLLSAGILTTITPCFLSILPLTLSYLSSSANVLINKKFFILGLFTNLFIITISINFLSYSYLYYLTRMPFISFLVLLIISLNLLQVVDLFSIFKIVFYENNNLFKFNFSFNSYLMGLVFGFTILPCSTPIILVINFWLYNINQIWISFFCLTLYFLGSILPFIFILNFVVNYFQIYMLSSLWNLITPFLGFIILTFSTFFFLEKLCL